MTKDQRQLGKIPSIMRVFLEHAVFAVSEELDGLFAFADEIVYEDFKIFVLVEKVNPVLVLRDDQPQMLVGVGEDVQDVRRRVLQILEEGKTFCRKVKKLSGGR